MSWFTNLLNSWWCKSIRRATQFLGFGFESKLSATPCKVKFAFDDAEASVIGYVGGNVDLAMADWKSHASLIPDKVSWCWIGRLLWHFVADICHGDRRYAWPSSTC